MAKKLPVSLEALMTADAEAETPAPAPQPAPKAAAKPRAVKNNVVTLQRQDATTSRRSDLPHTSIYLHPNVKKAIAQIGLDFGMKPHDVMMEGIDLMLAKYGKPPSKELAAK